ncbi:MAG: oligosaccharide flippase family protein [bacterium]|nr:oligosaccharide flippase family protein [bacterium]
MIITRARRLLSRRFVQDTLILQLSKALNTALSAAGVLILWRLMPPEQFGIFALAESLLALWAQLDFTGAGQAMYTRLGVALGGRDAQTALDVMAAYVRIGMTISIGIAVLVIVFGVPTAQFVQGSAQVGRLAGGLAVAWVLEVLYQFVMSAFGAARQMRTISALALVNQVVLTGCVIGALLIAPTPELLVAGRVLYAVITLALALYLYRRIRERAGLPALKAVARRIPSVRLAGYWRFGVANAIDKNAGSLFVQIPTQVAGIIGGAAAAGYLNLALRGIANAGILTAAIFENVEAVIPQAVGRGDFALLRRNLWRVIAVLGVGGISVFGGLVIVAPYLIPPILGAEWTPAVAPLSVLAFYGALAAVGGIFGPLYRAFNRMRSALIAKGIALAVMIPLALAAVSRADDTALMGVPRLNAFIGAVRLADPFAAVDASVIGAWLITLAFAISISLTAAVMFTVLRSQPSIRHTHPEPT